MGRCFRKRSVRDGRHAQQLLSLRLQRLDVRSKVGMHRLLAGAGGYTEHRSPSASSVTLLYASFIVQRPEGAAGHRRRRPRPPNGRPLCRGPGCRAERGCPDRRHQRLVERNRAQRAVAPDRACDVSPRAQASPLPTRSAGRVDWTRWPRGGVGSHRTLLPCRREAGLGQCHVTRVLRGPTAFAPDRREYRRRGPSQASGHGVGAGVPAGRRAGVKSLSSEEQPARQVGTARRHGSAGRWWRREAGSFNQRFSAGRRCAPPPRNALFRWRASSDLIWAHGLGAKPVRYRLILQLGSAGSSLNTCFNSSLTFGLRRSND